MSLLSVVMHQIETAVTTADEIDMRTYEFTQFHCRRAPQLALSAYLDRLTQHMMCSDEVFVIASYYLERLREKQPWLVMNTSAMYRLLLAGAVVAAKYFDDKFYPNAWYAKVGGISTNELNALEHLFLEYIDFELYFKPEEYEAYSKRLRMAYALDKNTPSICHDHS